MASIKNIPLSEQMRDSNPKINDNFKAINTQLEAQEGRVTITESTVNNHGSRLSTAETELTNQQSQINTLVLNGDSSPAAAQAAIDATGYDYGNLKARLDSEYIQVSTQLEDNAKKPAITAFAHGVRFSIEKYLNIFNNTIAGQSTIYWCWVIRVDDKLASPLGKYYLFYSTDHQGSAGHISLAYSNDLLTGWTNYGQIYKNGAYETETPSVVWDDVNGIFIMYFHSADSYAGENQTSWYVTSADALTWSDPPVKLLTLDRDSLTGDLHNGYFHPFKIGEQYYAYSLMGGGDNARFALSYSEDGYKWSTDYRLLAYGTLATDGRYMSYNHCTPVMISGVLYLIGMNTNFVSGSSPKDAYVAIAPLSSDFRNTIGKPVKLFNLDGIGESPNIRQVHVYSEANKLYIFYQCDNYLHCAVI